MVSSLLSDRQTVADNTRQKRRKGTNRLSGQGPYIVTFLDTLTRFSRTHLSTTSEWQNLTHLKVQRKNIRTESSTPQRPLLGT